MDGCLCVSVWQCNEREKTAYSLQGQTHNSQPLSSNKSQSLTVRQGSVRDCESGSVAKLRAMMQVERQKVCACACVRACAKRRVKGRKVCVKRKPKHEWETTLAVT